MEDLWNLYNTMQSCEKQDIEASDGEVRAISDIMSEKGSKATDLMTNLRNVIEAKNRRLEEMDRKYMDTRETIRKLFAENDNHHQAYYKEIKEMHFSIREHFQWTVNDYEITNLQLEKQQKELEIQSIEVKKCEDVIENERQKLAKEIQENPVRNRLLQSKRELLKLEDDHKNEMEKIHEKIICLKKQVVDGKQDVLLEMKHYLEQLVDLMHKNGNLEARKKTLDMQKNIMEMEEEVEDLEALNQSLIVNERRTNDELCDARKEFIDGLYGLPRASGIGVKRMGVLARKPFYDALKRKCNGEKAKFTPLQVCDLWEEYLRDPNWHPFKVISVNGKSEEVIDENDEKLTSLRSELGVEVLTAVTTALRELNDCNPSGRYHVPELWNFTQSRKATLQEGVSRLVKTLNAKKRKINWN